MLRRRRRRTTPKPPPLYAAALAGRTPEERRALFAGPDGPRWIEASAAHGIVEAQVLLGQVLLNEGKQEAARGWFAIAAGAGHAPAQNMLGRCAELGWGMERDLPKAAALYRQAAEAGLDWAQFNLGCLLLYGLGVPRDRLAAHDWFRRAAAQDHAKAMNMLGRCYEEGWNGTPDPVAAAQWYRRAAESGDFRAQYNWATILAARGRDGDAVAWLDRAFRAGTPDFLDQAGAALRQHPSPALRAFAHHRAGGASGRP